MKEKKMLKTGFEAFDNTYGGLEKGHVILLGGRPAMGKSAFAISLTDNICQRKEDKCLYASADQNLQVPKICDRLVTTHMGTIGGNNVYEDELTSRRIALNDVDKYSLILMDAFFESIDYKIEFFLREARREQVSLIVIDGLQKWFTSASGRLHKKIMNSFIQMIKELAVEQNCPILILSDLEMTADRKKDHRPGVADIRGIHDPFSVVDDVLLLFREEYYDKDTSRKEIAEVIVPSNCSDAVSKIDLKFSHKYARFY